MQTEELWLHVDAWIHNNHDVYLGGRLLVGIWAELRGAKD